MSLESIAALAPELHEIRKQLEKDFRLKAGHVFSLAPLELAPLEEALHPALVLLVAAMFGYRSDKVDALAKVTQFIYLATAVHNRVPEEDDGEEDLTTAYSMLVGDYLYGKFYVQLSRYDILEFLDPLAQTICRIHEGAMLRKEKWEMGLRDYLTAVQIAEKEHGALLAQACLLTGSLAGLDRHTLEKLEAFGLHLGTAIGFSRLGTQGDWKKQQGRKAKACLHDFPDTIQRRIMGQIVDLIVPPTKEVQKLVG